MAAEFKIGRLRYSWEGEWTSGTTYSRDSVVSNAGRAYVCLVPNTAGAINNTFAGDLNAVPYPYWQQMTAGNTFLGTWESGVSYSVGDIVTYGGVIYSCTTANTSVSFASDASYWSTLVNDETWVGAWAPNTNYGVGTLVTYGGIVYSCTANHTSAGSYSSGLEANSSDWKIYFQGVCYTGAWTSNVRYKLNDLVKLNSNIYICTQYHTSSGTFNTSDFSIFLPGQDFSLIWSTGTTYQKGDAVIYGGTAYLSLIANNQSNTPSSSPSAWGQFNVGYSIKGAWSTGVNYPLGSVVSQDGRLYEAIADNNSQQPALSGILTTYTSNTTTTLVVGSTSGVVPGMIVIGTGFVSGQTVVSVTDSTTLVLDRKPDFAPSANETIKFSGVNSTYWKLLVPSTYWTNRWTSGATYYVGDVVNWINGTYTCLQNHTASSGSGSGGNNRPDLDTLNVYWTLLVASDRNNSLTTYGDLETFANNVYTPVPIGTNTYNLRVNGNVPNWQKINVIPAVYYVDTNVGQDVPTYGVTWDQPWKTIKYACGIIGQGQYFPNATANLLANKGWMITEMYQWMLYQCANNIAPFSTSSLFDPFYTQRDAGYLIDAVIYDMQRGGNSQTVAATLRWFYYGSSTQFANQLIESAIAYFAPSITYLTYLMQQAIANTAPASSYQTLNGISGISYVNQYTNGATAESGASLEISTLMNIPITAVTNQNTYEVPASNSGLTAILNIKTGTYNESLPIVVPENLSIVGDELRSVTVQPVISLEFYATSTSALTNAITVTSTTGLADQMPIQFISPYVNNATTSFESNIVPGQTYYVLGSSITSTSFQILNTPTRIFTGTTVSGSNVISNASKISNLVVGTTVTGPGIPALTTVVSVQQAINSIATVTLSANVTVSGILQTFTATGSVVTLAGGVGNMLCYAGDCLKDMWYMTNGTTMRNLSNFGLLGMLSQTDAYGIARPTGGRYTSLNPGNGPDDTSVWIIRRSPYVQNVTNFGTGCIGTMSDGSLHNGGTKAMLHNDYTQVLSDGIGVWIANSGAISECVSVFSYYCYIGHFASGGGRIRSTNGNSSYGTFGVVSEGYDVNEVPATGTIFNQSQQVQASVAQAFGTTNNILKLNYNNAGSGYYNPSTNMIQYSNNFVSNVWSNDGNLSFIKNEVAPTGFTEAWLLTGNSNIPGTGYIQQSVSINPAGYVYTNVSGTTQNSQPGTGATFNITITSTAYTATVNTAGSNYAVTNQILIKGSKLGGVDGTNDCTITVGSLTGTGILSISNVSGTVPAGSAQNYTLSMYVYAGTSQTIDLQGIFSGNTTVVSGVSYNVLTNTVTPYAGTALGNSTNAGLTPVYYGANKTLVTGWYNVWLAINDITGLNNILTFKFFPQGANAPITNTYSIIYGAQLELSGNSPSPNFYLETTSSMFTAVANYEVVGNGSGALLSGDEIRSGAVFNARITTDSAGYTGGSGYATASNTAQGGNTYSITLSNADPGLYNYVGMRVFIQAGTGAGQFGYITYYNGTGSTVNGIAAKTALVCTDEVDQVSITQTTYSSTASNNLLTLATGTDMSKFYVNQAVQFTPTYYTSVVTSTSTGIATAISTVGGTTNTITLANASDIQLNMPVVFSGSGFNLTPGYEYYVVAVNYTASTIQVSNVIYGNPVQLSTVSSSANVTMYMSYPNYSGYLTASGTSTTLNVTGITSTTGVFSGTGFNLTYGQAVTITGVFSSGSITGYVEGSTYYVIGSPTSTAFQLSATYPGPGITPTALTTTTTGSSLTGVTFTASSITTGSMLPNIAIQFTGIPLGGVTLGNTYYIQDIIDDNNFTVSTAQVVVTSTSSVGGTTNTIGASTSSMVPLNPVVFGGTIFDASLTANTTYYISSIIDANDFQIATSIIRTIATQTYYTTNLIQIATSVANFVVGQPIIFSGIQGGSTFGNISPETVYYILTINTGTNQITISTDKVNPFTLTNAGGTAGGIAFVRTCPAPAVLGGGSGSMTVTTTGTRLVVSNSVAVTGTMNSTFQTSLIGGVNSYTRYYITAINTGSTPTISVSTSLAGTPITLSNGLGNMQMGASGWDNINPGTPSVSALDSTTNYYIEPRATFSSPSWSQTVGTMTTPLSSGLTWQGIAYGNNYFLAIPASGVTGAQSSNGQNWTALVLPSAVTTWASIAYGNFYWIALGTTSGGTSVAAYSNSNGTGWRTTNMPSNSTWSSICYGNGRFVAISTGTTKAAFTTNFGATWTASSTGLLATKTWVGLSYGLGLFLAIATDGTGAWSYDGNIWQATSLPASTLSITTGITISSGGGSFTLASATASQLVVGMIITITGTNSGSGSISGYTSGQQYQISATNGSTTFVLQTLGNSAITTSAGTINGLTFTISPSNYSGLAYGDNRFLAIQSGTGMYSAYSFNGIQWYQSQSYMTANNVVYGQGRFVATQTSGTVEWNSHAGVYWTQRSLTYGNINALGFGYTSSNVGVFPALSGTGSVTGNVTIISEGQRALGRATVTSGTITAVTLFEPGSNYTASPTPTFIDFNSQVTAQVTPRISNGTLGNPSFINRGSGYNTTSTTVSITGNGYADTYQTGYTLIINNLSTLPLVGSNLTIAGNSQIYKVTSATAVYGTQAPFIEANVQVSPTMTTALSPANGTTVSLRQLYSQVRLTNHDFLSIGVGNQQATNYPNVNEANALPSNEAIEVNQGHVFYTSTDENGNFLVGGLFGVEQATGTVTLSATQFGVQGLQTLSLGGIAVGGNQVIVSQFSTDPTFVANSDAIIPTQRAIKSYLTGRLSQGGSNTYTGAFTAGTVTVGGANYIESTIPNGSPGSVVKMKNKVYIDAYGVAGNMVTLDRFFSAARNKTEFAIDRTSGNQSMNNGS
jgi:hypothetical protein